MAGPQTHSQGLGEQKITSLEEQHSPLSLFVKHVENNFIESGQEHRFKPFNSIDNSGTIIFLIPSFSSEYIWLPR